MLHRLGRSKAEVCHRKEEASNEMLELPMTKRGKGGPSKYDEEYAPYRWYVQIKKEDWRLLMPLYIKEGCLVCLHWRLVNGEHSLRGHPVHAVESSECIMGRCE